MGQVLLSNDWWRVEFYQFFVKSSFLDVVIYLIFNLILDNTTHKKPSLVPHTNHVATSRTDELRKAWNYV